MKRFPLEPLSRVRDLRLEAEQRLVTACRAELAKAEQRLEMARKARGEIADQRVRHQQACQAAMSDPSTLVADWFDRAERHRNWLDAAIVRGDAAIAGAMEDVEKARMKLAEQIAVLRRAQAKVDALQAFRGEWQRGERREQERQEEQASEELFRAATGTMG